MATTYTRLESLGNTLARVQELTPLIRKRSEDIERDRCLPVDLMEKMSQTGCFRMLVPVSHGGEQVPLPEVLRVIEALARADGSAGWIASQVASAQLIFSYFSRLTLDEVYANGPHRFGAGAVAPKGRASRQDGGWRVTGQWPFASGCSSASWIYVQCIVLQNRKMKFLPNGMPETRMALFPAAEVEILDTWHVAGLQGTGSNDVRLSGAFCPDEHCVSILGSSPSVDDPIFKIPLFDQGGLFIAAVASGIAQGALEEIADLAAGGKRPSFGNQRLAEAPVFQYRMGGAYMDFLGARSLLLSQAEAAWAAATGRSSHQLFDRAVLRATTSTVVTTAARVVDTAYNLAGGSSIYSSSPLQRRLRDIHGATQHTYAGRFYTGVVGALLAREKIDETLF